MSNRHLKNKSSFDKIKQVKSDYEKSSNKGFYFLEKKWLVKTLNNPL